MKIYFLSAQPCALKLNGVYFGTTDRYERFVEVSLQDRIFVEFTPENALPIGFFLTESLRFSPPDGCNVYILADGIAVYAWGFPPKDFSLHVIAQTRFDDALVTLYRQGAIQLSIEHDQQLFNATLPPAFSSASLSKHGGLFFVEGKGILSAHTKTAECVFLEETLAYAFAENELHATLPLSDCLGRTAECVWDLNENGCVLQKTTIKQALAEQTSLQTLLPYVFLESVRIGADYAQFLCEELRPDAEQLRAFLGEFESVVLTRDPSVYGLLRKKQARLYEATYYTLEMLDGKISDVRG